LENNPPRKYKYTLVSVEFFRKHKDGKSLPSMENRRDIPLKSKNQGVEEPNSYNKKKRPEVRGAFKESRLKLS